MTTQVKTISRKLAVVGLLAFSAIVVLGVIAPFISVPHALADRFIGELEKSLGRKIIYERVTYSLFTGPGIAVHGVTIFEDPRYGLEPFASVNTLQAHLRPDKLLLGRVQFSSLRLDEPSLNLVKRNDGTWNIVELVDRLGAPRRMPLSFFPALEVSDARIDIKFDTRKTTLYISGADLSIYPERSGKLYVQFSGSPARTDRPGTGFGHVRGTANWYVAPSSPNANQLEADVTLEPSDLSELATLFQGYDIGVHGTLSSRARIEGPANALRINGELRLEDVHRWDLSPLRGEDWRIGYAGKLDAIAHTVDLETVRRHTNDVMPVNLHVRSTEFLTQPSWSLLARLQKAPAANLLPLAKRMGLALPEGLELSGTLDGVIGFSNRSGFAGGVEMKDAIARLPNVPPLRTANATTSISGDCIHFDPAIIETSFPGTLQASGDYYVSTRRVVSWLTAESVPIKPLEETVTAWFGNPVQLAAFEDGTVSGQLTYKHEGRDPAGWSGQIQVAGALLRPPGLALPVKQFASRVSFDSLTLDAVRFSGLVGDQAVQGDYHYNQNAKRAERLRLDVRSADLIALERVLEPALRPQGIFARLRFGKRAIPQWLAARDMEGDISVGSLSAGEAKLGSLHTHFVWAGLGLQFSGLQLNLQEGLAHAHGSVDLSGYTPRYQVTGEVSGLPWKSGLLSAGGEFETFGMGLETLQNLKASGTFAGQDLDFLNEDTFEKASGDFELSYQDGWPDVRLTQIRAADGDEEWNGQAVTQSDGKLLIDLEHAGQQRHLVSTIDPNSKPRPSTLTSSVERP